MFNKIRYEGFAEMGNNPASVEMDSRDLILNRDRFPTLPNFTKKFIIEHEKGHLNYDTDSEQLADEYALQSLYKSEKKSLKKSIKALVDILPEDDQRIETLYNKALEIDKRNTMNKFNMTNFLAGNSGRLRTVRYNANGDADTADADTFPADRQGRRRKRYISICGYAMTPAEVAILVLSVITIFKLVK